MDAINGIANFLLMMAIIAAHVAWIIGLCNWDGKCPCKPEDCENCVYSGTKCETELKNRKEKHL